MANKTRKQINKIIDKEIAFLQKQAKIAASGKGELADNKAIQFLYLTDIHKLVGVYKAVRKLSVKNEYKGYDYFGDMDTSVRELVNDDVYEYYVVACEEYESED